MDYHIILNQIKNSYSEILNENLVGIYVHGSIAFKCFNWNKSDIDYIVIVNEPLDYETKLKLLNATVEINSNAPPKGLEMSVVLKKYCIDIQYPTPYELHFSNMHLNLFKSNPKEYCEKMKGFDKDLITHFTIIKNVGVVLYGNEIANIFSEIPKEFYLDSIKHDIENAKNEVINNSVYVILNLCRALAFVNERLILSKEQGGIWGLKNINNYFHALIKDALNNYLLDNDKKIDHIKAVLFCEYMLDKIF